MKKAFFFLLVVMLAVPVMAQVRTVTGLVTDSETGEPLPGVSVVLVGTTVGAATDTEGRYNVRVPAGYNTLQYSFVGYATQRVAIDDRTEINIQLVTDILQLDDIVVVGYGTLPRRQITSSIAQIRREDIGEFRPVTVDQILQGRAAGVQFTSTSGVLGAPSHIRIRGAASISASTAPLVVIDGVPVTNPPTAGSASVGLGLGGGGMNPLLNIDPNDIESIEVLKDASAAAIYGSRGSNGVIVITTRQGRPDEQIVNIRTYAGTVDATNRYDMMNGEEFTRIWNDAGINRFGAEVWPATGLALPTEDIVNTDWHDVVSQTGFLTETSASVTGGTARTRYYVGGTYRSEEGFVRRNHLQRYSGRIRVDHALSDRVRIGLNASPSRTDNFRVYTENAVAAPFTFAALYYPNVPTRHEDGSLNLGVAPNAIQAFFGTPLSNVEGNDVESSLTQVLASGTVEWNVMRNLVFNTEFSVDLWQMAENFKRASYTTDGFPAGNAYARNDQFVNWNLNSTLTYSDIIDDHRYTVVGGITALRSERRFFDIFARGFPTDLLKNLASAADPVSFTGTGTSFTFMGYLARATYSYKDRYLVTLAGRLDGSSRFGREHRFGFFPAASAGWIVSDEAWFARLPVDFLKLRASFGQTGNAEIGNFPALGLVGFGFDYAGVPGGRITQLENPDLRWEKTTQFDGAVEFGIFRNFFRGSIGYYVKNTTDLLLNVPVSRVTGFTIFTQNIGEVQNRGWELELTANLFHRGDFKWTLSGNVSTVENEVTKLVEDEDMIFARNIVRVGEPLGAFYLVRYHGVNPENGNAMWLDLDGNPTETYSLANRVIAGHPFPDYFGGLNNSFAYGPVDLTVFFQFSLGNDVYRSDGPFTDSNLNSLFNQSTRQNDYWSPDNPDAANPQPRLLIPNGSQHSTRYLEDGSYIRLKQVTLGYVLPRSFTRDIHARIFVQGTNLMTITDYLGMDPEVSSVGNIQASDVFFQLPQPRTLVFGVDLTF